MLEELLALPALPPVLVIGASPLSMGLWRFSLASRFPERHGLDLWREQIGRLVTRELSFLPQHESGPEVIAARLTLWTRGEAGEVREQDWRRDPSPHTSAYREFFSHETAPAPRAVAATVATIRRCQERGARVVLVRLPVGDDMLALEDAWGARDLVESIAEATGAPWIDLNRRALRGALLSAIRDGSHVSGAEPRRQLSEAVGAVVRRALAGAAGPARPE